MNRLRIKRGDQEYEIVLATRNREIEYDESLDEYKLINKYLDTFLDICEKQDCKYCAFQGEMFGPKIQKNPLGMKEHKFLIFNYIQDGKRYSLEEVWKDPNLHKLSSPDYWVPIRSEFKLSKNAEEMLSMPDEVKTQVPGANKDAQIEGLVWRDKTKDIFDFNGKSEHSSFKCISNSYLLKHDG